MVHTHQVASYFSRFFSRKIEEQNGIVVPYSEYVIYVPGDAQCVCVGLELVVYEALS